MYLVFLTWFWFFRFTVNLLNHFENFTIGSIVDFFIFLEIHPINIFESALNDLTKNRVTHLKFKRWTPEILHLQQVSQK